MNYKNVQIGLPVYYHRAGFGDIPTRVFDKENGKVKVESDGCVIPYGSRASRVSRKMVWVSPKNLTPQSETVMDRKCTSVWPACLVVGGLDLRQPWINNPLKFRVEQANKI